MERAQLEAMSSHDLVVTMQRLADELSNRSNLGQQLLVESVSSTLSYLNGSFSETN